MRKNKHIRVQDSPVVPTLSAPTVGLASDGFFLADATHTKSNVAETDGQVIGSRLTIPVDARDSDKVVGMVVQGAYQFEVGALNASEDIHVYGIVRSYWSDLDPSYQTEQGSTLNGVYPRMSLSSPQGMTISYPSRTTFGQVHFHATGYVIPGQYRLYRVELMVSNKITSGTVTFENMGPYVTGRRIIDPTYRRAEGYWCSPADDTWDGGGLTPGETDLSESSLTGLNYLSEFPWYELNQTPFTA